MHPAWHGTGSFHPNPPVFRHMPWPCTTTRQPRTNADRGISGLFPPPSPAPFLLSVLSSIFLETTSHQPPKKIQKLISMQMKRYSQWGARLFFSATVAFSVPSIYKDGGLLRVKPFWTGLVLTVAAVVGKLVVGLYAGPPLTLSGFLKLGWAMNGRYVDRRFPPENTRLL